MWLLDKLFGIDEEEKRARELDAAREELNRKDLADGDYSAEVYQEMVRNSARSGGDGAGGDYDFSFEIESEFGAGWNEGADNIRGGLTSAINVPIVTFLKLIPWQAWLAIALYVAWRFGAFDGLLRGWMKKAA